MRREDMADRVDITLTLLHIHTLGIKMGQSWFFRNFDNSEAAYAHESKFGKFFASDNSLFHALFGRDYTWDHDRDILISPASEAFPPRVTSRHELNRVTKQFLDKLAEKDFTPFCYRYEIPETLEGMHPGTYFDMLYCLSATNSVFCLKSNSQLNDN